MNTVSKTLAVGTLMAMAQVAAAQSPLSVNVGLINVNPDSDVAPPIDADTTLGITGDFFLSDNVAVEVVAALPFEHEIEGVGSTKHLPPTVFAQYHIGDASSPFRPFVGAGLNYTIFFSEEVSAASGLTDFELDSSFGLAWQVGFNFAVDDAWGIHFMATQIDIDTDATLTTAIATAEATVEIDPLVVFLGVKFNL